MSNHEEYLFELRYKPNSKMLDKRGELAKVLSNEKLNFWTINQNTVVLKPDGDENFEAIFSYQNITLQVCAPYDKEFFKHELSIFLRSAWSHLPINELIRMGMRSKYFIDKDNFNDIYEKYRRKFLALTDGEIGEMGGSLIDVGFPLNFYEGPDYYDLMTGPLKKEQLKMFFKNAKETADQGLFVDVDFFNKDLSPNIRQKDVLDFIDRGLKKGEHLVELFDAKWLK